MKFFAAVALLCVSMPVRSEEKPDPDKLANANRLDWGVGSYRHEKGGSDYSLPTALDMPDLIEYDGAAFRFSSAPGLGGYGYAITLHETVDGTGRIEAVIVQGHPGLGWRKRSEFSATLPADRFAEAIAAIERLYALPTEKEDRAEAVRPIPVCADGPGYLSEISIEDHFSWLAGWCADAHPNEQIAQFMRQLVSKTFAAVWSDPKSPD